MTDSQKKTFVVAKMRDDKAFLWHRELQEGERQFLEDLIPREEMDKFAMNAGDIITCEIKGTKQTRHGPLRFWRPVKIHNTVKDIVIPEGLGNERWYDGGTGVIDLSFVESVRFPEAGELWRCRAIALQREDDDAYFIWRPIERQTEEVVDLVATESGEPEYEIKIVSGTQVLKTRRIAPKVVEDVIEKAKGQKVIRARYTVPVSPEDAIFATLEIERSEEEMATRVTIEKE